MYVRAKGFLNLLLIYMSINEIALFLSNIAHVQLHNSLLTSLGMVFLICTGITTPIVATNVRRGSTWSVWYPHPTQLHSTPPHLTPLHHQQ